MKTTDLVDVAWKKGGRGFSFSLIGAPSVQAQPPVRLPTGRLVPVTSPGGGFYHAAPPGKSRSISPAMAVRQDENLGYLEAGPKRWEVKSPCPGAIAQVLIEEGQPAEYGQPLFVIEMKD